MQRAVFPRPSRFAVPTATVSSPQVNYKVRPDGRPAIFEINVRLGADVACEVEPARLRLLLERLGAAAMAAVLGMSAAQQGWRGATWPG